MGATPVYGLPWPELATIADGPDAVQDLAVAVEGVFTTAAVSTYTPVMHTADGNWVGGNGTFVGRYQRDRGVCQVNTYCVFGSTTNGGSGAIDISLPVAGNAALAEQYLMAKLWVPNQGINFFGLAVVRGGEALARPLFVMDITRSDYNFWTSQASGGGAGSGVPAIGGSWSVQNTGNFALSGSYITA